ncbi:hypothetical protein JXO52_06230 [bacterium]|nr:hypothetical protein [bacterium]
MKVLLSIKPDFVEKVFSGEKKYEFRRVIFKKSEVNTVVVYASKPVHKVIGEFSIKNIICDDIVSLWTRTKDFSGISEDFFFQYFNDRDFGYAIEIGKVKKYNKALSLQDHFNVSPPQSFMYL